MAIKNDYEVAVVGAGIVGLAMAYTAAREGKKVAVFERSPGALGASVRNFGLVWPVGQTAGNQLDRALRSRSVWMRLIEEAGVWANPSGSLHLAYHDDEMAVLEEFLDTTGGAGYNCKLLTTHQVAERSPAVVMTGLKGGLFSATEVTVSPRQAIPRIAAFLEERYGVEFHWSTAITHVESGHLSTFYDFWSAEQIMVCNGADFVLLYPREFAQSGLMQCKLQMMRTSAQPDNWKLGPALCAGLTLRHYANFAHCPSLAAVNARYDAENPDYSRYGIHVLLSQNHLGQLIIGDSHEYGQEASPFNNEDINQLILRYLHSFAQAPEMEVAETWYGVYPKCQKGAEIVFEPEPGVTIVNGLGGAGMTLSFGLAQEIWKGTYTDDIPKIGIANHKIKQI